MKRGARALFFDMQRLALVVWLLALPALALGAGASEVFEKVKDAVAVVRAIGLHGQEVGQGSGVVLPSGQVATKNLAVPLEWQGELLAQSKKAEAPSEAKSPKQAPAPTHPVVPPTDKSSKDWEDRATALSAAEDWAGLMEHSKRWTKAQPKEPFAWMYVAFAYDRLGRYQEAVNAYKEVVRLEPDLAEAGGGLGAAYSNLGRYQEAVEANKEALRLKPNHADAWNNLGVAYSNLGLWQEALEANKEALRLKPDLADAWNNLGLAYFGLGNRSEALKAVQELRRYDQGRADKLFNIIMGR
jgi:tetratricopeptide (TPR) repeat protein